MKSFYHWMSKASWAILDHGSFAASNFLLNIILARWLSTVEYGVFTVGYGMFLFFGTFHTALLTQPLIIFGAERYQQHLSQYLEAALIGHFRLTAVTSLLLLFGAILLALLQSYALALCLLTLAFVSPFILLQWMMRRASYLSSDGSLAARAGLGYMALILLSTSILYNYSLLSSVSVLLMMGVASFVTGCWIIAKLELRIVFSRWPEFSEAVRSHWNFGRWSIGTGIMSWATGNIYYLILPIWGGFDATAAFRALQNFVLPIFHLAIGLISVLQPSLVRARRSKHFIRIIFRVLIMTLCLTSLYGLGIVTFGEKIMKWSYGEKYMEYTELLWILAVTAVCYGIVFSFRLVLLALEKPEFLFKAYFVSTVFIFTIGIVVVRYGNVWGAAYISLISLAIIAVTLGMFTFVEIKKWLKNFPKMNSSTNVENA